MSWLRLYVETMDDPKVMQLEPKVFRAWIVCLCLAKEGNAGYGVIPDPSIVAFKLHVSEAAARGYMEQLVERGLIDVSGNVSTPHNWDARQYKSDVSTSRVQRFRNKQKSVSGNGSETFQKPPQSTEYRVQSTEYPQTPVEQWVETLLSTHPGVNDPRFTTTFCTDNWHRLSEDAQRYEGFMAAVLDGLKAHCAYWALDGNRFAVKLDTWLAGRGWTKAPPRKPAEEPESVRHIPRKRVEEAEDEGSCL